MKLLCVNNIWFFKNQVLLPHHHAQLQSANSLYVTFGFQKSVAQHATKDPVMCLVHVWAMMLQCILSYPINLTEINEGPSQHVIHQQQGILHLC